MRVDSPSSSSSFSVRLAAALLVMTIASTAAAVAASDTLSINHHETTPYSLVHNNAPSLQLPPHIQQHLHHHQHQQHLKRYSSSQATSPQAWIDYYSSTGAFISETTFSSGACLSLSSSWGILDITPFTRPNPTNGERDQLVFYNDRNCVSINREPASKTGYVVIAMYFNKVPQSLQWTRVTSGSATTTTTTTTTTSSVAVPATTVTAPQPPSTLTSSIPTPLASPPPQPPSPDTAGDGSAPSPPRHSQFPNALIPPKPLPDSSSSSAWGDNCGGPENDPDSPGCKGARQVTHFLIVGITIAVVAVGFMAAGSLYIYRRFYAPEPLPTTTGTGGSSSYRSNQHSHNNINNNNSNSLSHNTNSNSYAFSGTHNMNSSSSNSHTASGTGTVSGSVPGRRLGDDANPDYQYSHDEDDEPDDGSKPPKFMFDHRHDNINTNRNPRFFQESSPSAAAAAPYPNNSSDIALIERVRK